MKRIALVLTAALIFGVYTRAADARVFTSPGSMEADSWKYVENSDGTWTEYYQGGLDGVPRGEPVRGDTYSAGSFAESNELGGEIAVEEGTTGQSPSIILGSDIENVYASEGIVGELRTGQLYMDYGEAQVGDEAIQLGIDDGTLPTTGAVAGGLAGAIIEAGGAAVTGIAIGTGIDELMGWPSFASVLTEGSIAPGCYAEGISNCKWESGWSSSKVKLGEVNTCEYRSFLYPYHLTQLPGTPEGELCEFPVPMQDFRWRYFYHGGEVSETCNNVWADIGSRGAAGGLFAGTFPKGECNPTGAYQDVPTYCPTSPEWVRCFQAFSGPAGASYSEPQGGYNELEREYFAPLSSVLSYAAYPAEGDKGEEQGVEHSTSTTLPAQEPITVPHPAPSFIPAPLRHVEIQKGKRKRTKEQEEKSEPGSPLISPLEKGATIPSPLQPQVPAIGHDETWVEYEEALHREGLKDPHEEILTEANSDTGPEGVVQVSPSPGTLVQPDTQIDVQVNPDNAPSGGEGGSSIGPPTLPGIKLPELHLLCTTMPFGVPCWLFHELEAFSSTGAAPVWHIGPFHTLSFTIPEAVVHLSDIEPVMEKVRPFMILFGTIGVVLLFFKIFTGKSVSGENPPSEVPGPEDIPQPDEDTYL